MSRPAAEILAVQALRLTIGGRVQGVGFRPFVHRLAVEHGLTGQVQNRNGQVLVEVQGAASSLAAFQDALLSRSPAIAEPRLLAAEPITAGERADFRIVDSEPAGPADIHLPPDYHCCEDCLRELDEPADRRHRYPFINCTQCGPRYTLIDALPYDRQRTAMAGFELCPDCRREYQDPADRRFHAEPLACPVCGPQLSWRAADDHVDGNEAALAACVAALRAGRIVAVKGVGGYHLMCDARDASAIERLRQRKARPHKPLAVLFADVAAAVEEVVLDDEQAALLEGASRPIVLTRRRAEGRLPAGLAPGLAELGILLPDSPLRHLLVRDFAGPLVCTSANLAGEPVLTEAVEVEQRLSQVADARLHHDRPIRRPADDSLYRHIAGRCRPLRLGRGTAPLELELPRSLSHPLLAVGGHMKNTIALAWDNRVVISPHIGDLDTPRSRDLLAGLVEELQALYGVKAERVAHDAHPGYGSSRWARSCGLPLVPVWHHHAHAAVLAGECPGVEPWLVFTWDGVGLGEDGHLWGGEALLGTPGNWQRVASLHPFRLPGGDKAARQPWRSALALCWETDMAWPDAPQESALLHQAWQQGLNVPTSSAAGRLFDAAAALTGVCHDASYEGQAPAWLESLAVALDEDGMPMPMTRDEQGVWRSDWSVLLPMLADASQPAASRATRFHAAMARCLVDQAVRLRDQQGDFSVGLAGGVFQNRRLAELAVTGLRQAGFAVHLPQRIPLNDAGLCFGQVMEVLARD